MAFTTMPVEYSEQIKIISDFFSKWSECERTVAICKLLKFLPGFWLKFVLSTIEQQFSECPDNEHIQRMEQQSNSKSHLSKLYEAYKMTSTSDLEGNNNNYHHLMDIDQKKEKILKDILRYTLLLKCGNDEAKKDYLSLIPYMVEDARRGIVPTKIVQQILSFLLIHPALNDYDRRSLKEHNKMLQEHIRNSIHTEKRNSNSWQVVAPPSVSSTSSLIELKIISTENLWETQSIPFSPDLNSTKSTDDHHVSFSKNGTEIPDFDPDLERSNIHFTYDCLPILNDHIAMKTRRSNSLTTGVMHHDTLLGAATLSTENLATAMQKQRSFSLCTESPRSSVTSSSSETRLNELNPSAKPFISNQAGMSNMNSWLKGLRLHKYQHIFIPLSYNEMMEVTEEYLTSMAVTKGARNKLVICIQKLKERFQTLERFERDLVHGRVALSDVLAEMTEILKTPIKPIDAYNSEDVANQFMRVLSLACNILTMPNQLSIPNQPCDQQVVITMLQIVSAASHNEAFVSCRDELREYQYQISEINKQFPKTYSKNGAGNSGTGNPNKSRWSTSTKLHTHTKVCNEHKPHRKNFSSMVNFASMQSQSTGNCGAGNNMQSQQSHTNYYSPSASYKSSSYPKINSSGGIQHGSQHHSYHRHSVSNLITITPSQTTASIVTTPSATHMQYQPKSATAMSFIASKSKPAISTSQLPHQNATTTISGSAAAIATKLSKINNNNSTSNANLSSMNGRSHSFGGAANQQMLTKNVTDSLSSDREFFFSTNC